MTQSGEAGGELIGDVLVVLEVRSDWWMGGKYESASCKGDSEQAVKLASGG